MAAEVQRRVAGHSLLTSAIAGEMVNSAHSELIESHPWSRRYTEIIILTTAQESTGTWTVTNGSSTATAGATVSLGAADEGKYIRFGTDDSLYVIGAISGSNVTLEDFKGNTVSYAGTTSTTATYVMFPRWYNIGTAVERVLGGFYKQKISEITQDQLDNTDPVRSTTGDPTKFVLGPRDTSDRVQIELWPRPTGTIGVPFRIEVGHTDLSGTNTPIVPSNVVVWKASILACDFIFAKTGDERWLALANKYEKDFEKTFKRMADQDEPKAGLPHYIQDPGRGSGLAGTDFALSHDVD
jgi:hypothetical protein